MATDTSETSDTNSPLKILLVADELFQGPDVLAEIQRNIDGKSAQVEVFVIATALASSGLQHEMAEFDGPIREANSRLENMLSELEGVGIKAIGEVGEGDPIIAIGDGLREFPADQIIVVGHEKSDRKYAEKDLWDRIRNEFHEPVSVLMVGHPGSDGEAPSVDDVKRDSANAQTPEEETDANRNFPHLTPRDITGMLIGFFGTIALGLIALSAGTMDDGDISGAAAAILLIAIGAFLVNVAHIVGLLFFQSVRYTGIWEKFMARLSIIFTVAGLIAALILWTMV